MEHQTDHIGDINKMITMKLYTEEQVIKVWKAGQKYWETSGASITLQELLEQETSIELPSDGLIKKEATTQMEEWSGSGCEEEIFAFIKGAKWMRDKILSK